MPHVYFRRIWDTDPSPRFNSQVPKNVKQYGDVKFSATVKFFHGLEFGAY